MKEVFNLDYFKDVSEVIIRSSDDEVYNGKKARVLDVLEHKYGFDLRVVVDNGESFWISSDCVSELERIV